MGLLDRLRGWLGASGGDGTASDGDADETDDDGPRLDPGGATEVRTREEDDPVERLRDVETRRDEAGSEPEPDDADDAA